MKDVTSDEVKEAMIEANLERVLVRNCSMCGYQMEYIREGENLFYDAGCHCTYMRGGLEPRDWNSISEWINMQSADEHKIRIAEKFGIKIETPVE